MPRKYSLQGVSIVLALAVLGCEQSVTDVVDWTAEANHPSITALLPPGATPGVPLPSGDQGGANLPPADGDILSGTYTNVGMFTVAAGTTVYVDGFVDITAADVLIAGTLDATGAGDPGPPGRGSDGPGGDLHSRGGGGGGYGGDGGRGGAVFSAALGGAAYGAADPLAIQMGSAGGDASSNIGGTPGAGGAGGGAIKISAGTITVSGTIEASGADGGPGAAGGGFGFGSLGGGGGGGGSGGGIWLDGVLDVTGSLGALGGAGGTGEDGTLSFFGLGSSGTGGGGGGGGRIKVSGCGSVSGAVDVTGGAAGGGSGSPTDGDPGTAPADDALEPCATATSASFLIIDEEGIGKGSPPNSFDEMDVNEHIADIGLRTQLPFFAAGADVGQTITLHTGEVGDEGWFALKKIPASWDAAGPTSDGLLNFLAAGPGLGTEDADGDREALLDKIPDVTPLRAMGLKQLEGQRVCAVVYKGDVSINYDPLDGSLKGDNLGTVAFEVLSVTKLVGFSSSSLPEVVVEILDADAVCEGPLTLLTDAPEPISSSEPFDVDPS